VIRLTLADLVRPHLYVTVKDVDRHFERARKAGAAILEEPADTSYQSSRSDGRLTPGEAHRDSPTTDRRVMPRKSAGLLLFRDGAAGLEVLLVHPGGPFWANKDEGAWSIPKGEFGDDEDPLAAARREFAEETGHQPDGEFIELEPVRQSGGKLVYGWALRADLDPSGFRSNTFTMEWPPRSGRRQEFPEIDRADWFSMEQARRKILESQAPLLDALRRKLSAADAGS
jgi:predicted NUDIX family NTP pyrophosphohydrolase